MIPPLSSSPPDPAARPWLGFSVELFLGDAAGLAWLHWAMQVLTGHPAPATGWLVGFSLTAATVAWFVLGHRSRRRRWHLELILGAVFGVALGCGLMAFAPVRPTPAGSAWFAIAGGMLVTGLRLGTRAATACLPAAKWELLRWLLLAALAVRLTWPYYHPGGIGAGDAHWYAVMLADFVEQLRAGIFPVWTGQSSYAFNGAVVPLRVAPLYQHEGGLLDLVTARALGPLALRNAIVALNAQFIVFSAYGALRAILPRRPGTAATLAGLFFASPAVLAPLYAGDQIMTFVAVPFLPPVFYGGWRIWARDDRAARVWLVVGLAGLWLAHPPIGMWTTFCAGFLWATRIWCRVDRRSGWRDTVEMAAVFSLVGSWPFASTLSLDNLNSVPSSGGTVVEYVRSAFPANFLPVSSSARTLADYQPGYSVLALLALAALWWRPRRTPGATALATIIVVLPTLMLPVPGWLNFFWTHVPGVVVNITNTWPMQRLMVIWTAAIVFFVAGILSARDSEPGNRLHVALAILALPLCAWTLREAEKFPRAGSGSRTFDAAADELLVAHNRLLTRYAYSSFSRTPYYFSEGYTDPLWENRLLRSSDERPVATNAEGAMHGTPVTEGTFTAINDNHSNFYNLSPALTLEPGRRYALSWEFVGPPESAVLQLKGGGIFREYALPDSGEGISPRNLTRAFGALPTSQSAVSLWSDSSHPVILKGIWIARERPLTPEFPLARFSLYAYRPEELPIRVTTLAPYRVVTYTPEPAWLETPRVWLGRYRANVNGHLAEVRRSANNLAMIRLDLGHNEVALDYTPGFWLSISYWTTLLTWFALGFWAVIRLLAVADARDYLPEAAGHASGAN